MREMTLKEIQRVSFDILKEFHRFCIENGLTYSLDSGTLIGAVRHHGFIPWDDDIDVIMPRKDFDLLCKTWYSSKGYKIFSNVQHTSYNFYARICEMSETVVYTDLPWCEKSTGVWIDIFPIDGADDDEILFKKRRNKAQLLLKDQWRFRFIKKGLSLRNPIYNLRLIKRVFEFIIKYWSFDRLMKKQSILSKEIPFECANYWSQYAFFTLYQYNTKSSFEYCIPMKFETDFFLVMNGYDEVLRNIYGNYMELPPVSDRTPKHYQTHYYWRE